MIGAGEAHVFHNHNRGHFDDYTNNHANIGANPLNLSTPPDELPTLSECASYFRLFLHTFDSALLAQQLIQNIRTGKYMLDIHCEDILNCKPLPNNEFISTPIKHRFERPPPPYYLHQLYKALTLRPLHYLSTCEEVCHEEVLKSVNIYTDKDIYSSGDSKTIPYIQINLLNSSSKPSLIRDLLADTQEKFVVVPGIIIQASKLIHKMNKMTIQCRYCDHKMQLIVPPWREKPAIPRQCKYALMLSRNKADSLSQNIDKQIGCKGQLDTYVVVPSESSYLDVQSLKLQEFPEDVPTGDMPRHLQLNASRYLCEKVNPGDRIYVHGVLTSYESNPKLNHPGGTSQSYLHVLGIHKYDEGPNLEDEFSLREKSQFQMLAQSPDIHSKIFNSIAPSIYGMEHVKQAAACLLFGGVRKQNSDDTKLRGDINVLLLGDPSVAKSQILKFIDKLAPISIYTSGKGSSAAGLTAAVIRDRQGIFSLEGGAMVLADGGIVCIDEFDKMGEDDLVAIHEAMEQQTISITKAGISTVLNSRCSVIAAANPSFGSFDSSQDTSEQHEFKSTLLSRFDLIFLLRDKQDVERDSLLCSHIISLHSQNKNEEEGEIPFLLLKKYIKYARTNCYPTLSQDATELVSGFYRQTRNESRGDASGSKSKIPITIRQLESIIRIAESLARMELKQFATIKHVQMAINLFTVSSGETSRQSLSYENLSAPEKNAVKKAEEGILGILSPGQRSSRSNLLRKLENKGFEIRILKIALFLLVKSRILQERTDLTLLRMN